jgi:leucyl/phenylalanyl-tRNA---protein transferase
MIAEMAWEQVDLTTAEADLPVAVGGSLAPHRLLEALRHGAFPLPSAGDYGIEVNRILYGDYVDEGRISLFPPPYQGTDTTPYAVTWWCPPTRPVLPAASVRLPKRLKQDLRNKHSWITTCDHAFEQVVEQCRDQRGIRWITDELRDSLVALHAAGWAHSIEVWSGPELIGGLFGTGMGGLFCAESMFHRRPDASKVAIADLGRRLAARPGALIDVQIQSPITTDLGAAPISRTEFLDILGSVDLPLIPETGVLPVAPLGATTAV